NVRRLVVDHVITGAGPWAFVEFPTHLARNPGLDLLGELALLVFVVGPVEREAQQRIAELVGVCRIQVHVILPPGQVLARQTDGWRRRDPAIQAPPSSTPSPSWICWRPAA